MLEALEERFKDQLPKNVVDAMRPLFKLDDALFNNIEEALVNRAGADGLDHVDGGLRWMPETLDPSNPCSDLHLSMYQKLPRAVCAPGALLGSFRLRFSSCVCIHSWAGLGGFGSCSCNGAMCVCIMYCPRVKMFPYDGTTYKCA